MEHAQREQRSATIHAVVVISSPSDPSKPTRTVFSSLRRGAEKLWFSVESVPAAEAREAAMRGIWRVLGEAVTRRLTKLDVYVSDPTLVPILERQEPVPEELGLWYIQVRSRCNQIGRVRFVGVGRPATEPSTRRRTRTKRDKEPTLFGSAVA